MSSLTQSECNLVYEDYCVLSLNMEHSTTWIHTIYVRNLITAMKICNNLEKANKEIFNRLLDNKKIDIHDDLIHNSEPVLFTSNLDRNNYKHLVTCKYLERLAKEKSCWFNDSDQNNMRKEFFKNVIKTNCNNS